MGQGGVNKGWDQPRGCGVISNVAVGSERSKQGWVCRQTEKPHTPRTPEPGLINPSESLTRELLGRQVPQAEAEKGRAPALQNPSRTPCSKCWVAALHTGALTPGYKQALDSRACLLITRWVTPSKARPLQILSFP